MIKAKSKEGPCHDFSRLAPENVFDTPDKLAAMGAGRFFARLFNRAPKILGIFRRSDYMFTDQDICSTFASFDIVDPGNYKAEMDSFLPRHDYKEYNIRYGYSALVTKVSDKDGNVKYRVWVHDPCRWY